MSCCAVGCTNRFDTNNKTRKFYRIPAKNTPFKANRRRLWLRAIRRGNWSEQMIKNASICSDHFISGAASEDYNSPDFVPSVFAYSTKDGGAKLERYKRKMRRDESLRRGPNTGSQSTPTSLSPNPCGMKAGADPCTVIPAAMKGEQQRETKPLHIKKKQEGEQHHGLEEDDTTFPFNIVTVKSEDEERQSDQMETGADEEDRGGSTPEIKVKIEEPSEPETDDSEDWRETREDQSGSNSEENIKDSTPLTGNGCYSCPQCGKAFRKKCNVGTHMRIHIKEKHFSCSECGKAFQLKSRLARHVVVHIEETPFSCSECGKRFKRKAHLNSHMFVHSREKSFGCSECEKQYKQKSQLARHMKMHTKEKLLSCSECGKRYKQKSRLARHMKTHTKKKPFSCSECGKQFKQTSRLDRHMMSHSNEKSFSCTECGKCFQQESDLKCHMTRHTGGVQQLSLMKEEPSWQQEWSSSLHQEDTRPQHIKEEQADTTTFPFNALTVKNEDEEEKPHQRQTDQIGTAADEEDCGGAEPDRNSDPESYSVPEIEVKIEDSSEPETDDSDD